MARFAPLLALGLALCGPAGAEGEAIPVPRVTIYPGDVIVDGLLVDRLPPVGDANGAHVQRVRQGLLGKVAKQTLLPGQPIPLNGVREPFVVKQGQAALVMFQSGDLVISSTAVSLQAGGVGELISLRNSDSGITIKGVVQADGSIRVGSP